MAPPLLAAAYGRAKMPFGIPSMLPLLSSPFYTFFSSLYSSFKGVSHRKYFYCSNVHRCSYEHLLRAAWRAKLGVTARAIILGSRTPMLPVTWPDLSRQVPCGVGTSRLQRPSIRAGLGARHPMLSAPFDDSWKAQEEDNPLSTTACFAGPEFSRVASHQHQGLGVTFASKKRLCRFAYRALR